MPNCAGTNERATSMEFYNMQQGDAPYTKYLADHYAISDNYHQPAMGGTGLDGIMVFFGDALYFSDDGNPLPPPHNQMTWAGGPVDEVENPNSQPGTNKSWVQDGYGGFGNYGNSVGVYGGGSDVNCSDPTQPGVKQICNYLASLKPPIKPNCAPNAYYLVNNSNPGYFGDGSDAYLDSNPSNTPFTIPGVTQGEHRRRLAGEPHLLEGL